MIVGFNNLSAFLGLAQVDECFNQLKEAGFPVPSVRREKYISSK
jgi:hypothetical protein